MAFGWQPWRSPPEIKRWFDALARSMTASFSVQDRSPFSSRACTHWAHTLDQFAHDGQVFLTPNAGLIPKRMIEDNQRLFVSAQKFQELG